MNAALPRDAALPLLAQALDPHAMAGVFATLLGKRQLLACEVERVKYRPGRNCTLVYRLHLRGPRPGCEFEQRVAARLCSGGESARRYRNATGRAGVASAAGPAVTHLPALDMVVHWWPNDARLDAPRLLHDAALLRRRCLGEVVAALTGGRGCLIDHQTTVVQAVPELRVCARVVLRLVREAGAAVSSQTLYVKADLERAGAGVHAVMQALRSSPAQASGHLRTPPPLLWQQAAGLHWQLALPGRALEDVDPQVSPATGAKVARQLAALHATPVPTPHTTTIEALCAQVHQAAGLLARVEPAWLPVLQRLAHRLDAGVAALAGQVPVTLHGDLHPRNILVDGAQHAFIDLDSVRAGPAVVELGAWVADLLYRATLAGVPSWHTAASRHAFLAAYAQAAGQQTSAALLAWSTAHDLLCKRAYRCVANLKPGRFAAVGALLAQADAIVGAGSVDVAAVPALEAA